MKKKRQDSQYEGRDKAFMDVDRMINEGMAGGTVSMKFDSGQIEETNELLKEEEQPHNAEKD